MTKFGANFCHNFAMGVATGITMNFNLAPIGLIIHIMLVIFYVPLAIEGLMAFF